MNADYPTPANYEWGIARPRKAVRAMPTEEDARDTVCIAVETWGDGIGWKVVFRKVGGTRWETAA